MELDQVPQLLAVWPGTTDLVSLSGSNFVKRGSPELPHGMGEGTKGGAKGPSVGLSVEEGTDISVVVSLSGLFLRD